MKIHTAIACLVAFLCQADAVAWQSQKLEISDDGNVLFYNSPVAARVADTIYFSYISRSGIVYVRYLEKGKFSPPQTVHDYSDRINRNAGLADDHAAPAIIYDAQEDRLILATSYHGSPMFLYEFRQGMQNFKLIRELPGRYTYPRLVEQAGKIFLISRFQQHTGGHLVVLESADNFRDQTFILRADSGTGIYAGSVGVDHDGLLVSYSKNVHAERRLIGWYLLKYSPSEKRVIYTCDLSFLLGDNSYSNRPTGIGVGMGKIMAGSAYFDRISNESSRGSPFSRKNTVAVAQGENGDCESFALVHKGQAAAPYYNTSIAISDHLQYLYFDKDRHVSNTVLPDCFDHPRMMYPSLMEFGIVFAGMNRDAYSIRNFDNSLYFCAR